MRLTYKINDKEYAPCKNTGWKTFDKLGQLEDIEDELGIDLIILFKALKNGVYVRLLDYTKPTFKKTFIDSYNMNIKSENIDIRRDILYNGFDLTGGHLYYFKDYGKTWALTKEELE